MKSSEENLKPRKHPYEKFEGTRYWRIVESAIAELVNNHDLVEQTPRDHIVGYICKQLSRAD